MGEGGRDAGGRPVAARAGGGGGGPRDAGRRPVEARAGDGAAGDAAPPVAVDPSDALEDVLNRVRDAGAATRTVELTVPTGSALFLTAAEFRALKEVADRGRLAVGVRSPDALRLQLARMLGFEAIGETPPRPRPPAPPAPAEPPPTAPVPPAAPSRSSATPAAKGPPARGVPSVDAPPVARATQAPSPTVLASSMPAPAPAPRASSPTVAAEPVGGADAATPAERAPVRATAPSSPPAADPAGPRPVAAPPTAPGTVAVPTTPPVAEAAAPRNGTAEAATETPATTAPAAGDPPDAAGAGWPDPPEPHPTMPSRRRLPALSFALPLRARRTASDPDTVAGAAGTAVGAVAATPDAVPSVPQTGDGTGAPPFAAGADGTTADGDAATPATERSAAATFRGWRDSARARPLPWAVGAAVAVLALVAAGVAFLLPRAEVNLVLRRQPVRAAVLYDVTENGEPLGPGAELAVAAEPATVEVAVEASIPASGVRREPDATAAGAIRLANPTAEEVTVEAGTVVATEEGVEFALVEDVTVPAADQAAGEVGGAVGEVRALEPGTGGNVETGTIGGRLPNGVYYSNRDGPTEGGTDREIRVVAPEDLEALRAEVDEALPARAEDAFARELGEGTTALPSSFEVEEGSEEFDHEAGEEAETVSVRAVRSVTALTYDPAEVEAELDDELREKLGAAAPDGYAVDAGALDLAPVEQMEEDPAGMRFRLAAEAEAEAVLDEDARRDLAERLEGKDRTEAEAILAEVPQIEAFDVAYRPGLLPDRMPGSADRIEIGAGS